MTWAIFGIVFMVCLWACLAVLAVFCAMSTGAAIAKDDAGAFAGGASATVFCAIASNGLAFWLGVNLW